MRKILSVLPLILLLAVDCNSLYNSFQRRCTPTFCAVSKSGRFGEAMSARTSSSTETPCSEYGVVQRYESPFLPSVGDASQESQPKGGEVMKTALIILNTPIQCPPSPVFQKLWESATLRVCADGGANRLYTATMGNDDPDNYIPDMIRGDLDSLKPHVQQYFESKGCKVERDPDQDSNDLDKALQKIKAANENGDFCNTLHQDPLGVCIYGAFGGRFDQEMGCIQALYKWASVFKNRLYLYDDQTCAFLLPPNVTNEIRLPFYGENPVNERSERPIATGEGPTCGLIPIGCKCDNVRTTGLKWNLDGSLPLEFGGMVSTSNRMMEQVVTIKSSEPIVFTAEMTAK